MFEKDWLPKDKILSYPLCGTFQFGIIQLFMFHYCKASIPLSANSAVSPIHNSGVNDSSSTVVIFLFIILRCASVPLLPPGTEKQ